MRISLIHVTVREASNLVPPLGILTLAAVLRERGFEVQVLDEDPLVSDVVSRVSAFNPAVVGMGFYTPAYSRARVLASTFRSRLPAAILCAGGVHTTARPEQTLGELELDFCVVGEGEHTFLEVCERIRDGRGYEDVAGLVFREGDRTVSTGARPLIEDLDSLPMPARDAVDYRRYLKPPGVFRGRPMGDTTTLLTVRGCPFRCTYCGSHIMSRGKVRYRSLDSVVREVESLMHDYGVKGIFIVDESFTLKRERAIDIARFLHSTGIDWAIQTRVDLLDEDLIRELKRTGCREINFGVESGSERILNLLRKGTTVEQAVRTFEWCRKAGVRTTANFMIGHPEETTSDIEATYKLARTLSASYTLFHVTIPYPGTELYRQAMENGWLQQGDDFDDLWMHRSGGTPLLKTKVPHATLKKLRATYQNRFFVRNYVSVNNLPWFWYFGRNAVSHPRSFARAFGSMMKTRRLDTFLEVFAAETYTF